MTVLRNRVGGAAKMLAPRQKPVSSALPARQTQAARRALVSPASAGPRPLRQVASVNHQGTVIIFARDMASAALYYNVLDLQVTTVVDNMEWTGFVKLDFPEELRPAGLGIITVANPKGAVEADAAAPLKVVTDERYVCVFQQSSRGTLLLNRFMLKRIAPAGGGVAIPTLEPVWEVRFERSGKQDVPDGPRDSQNYRSPDGVPFIEPTIELSMIGNLADGRFEALILPSEASSAKTWQFFAVNAQSKRLDLFAFAMDPDGLFDLSDKPLGADGNVLPDVTVALTLSDGGNSVPLTLAGGPAATLYTLRERVRTTPGSSLLLKRTARVLLTQPVTRPGSDRTEIATLDFALGKNGRLARIAPETSATLVAPANDALEFAATAYLALPNAAPLSLAGSFQADFWLMATSAVDDEQYVFRGDPAVGANEAAPYVKVTRDLAVELGFGTGGAAVAARTANAVVVPETWVHVAVAFDADAPSGNFQIRVNDNAVPVVGADNTAKPAGRPITTIGALASGIVGVLDRLKLSSGPPASPTLVGDWPFDSVDYQRNPPTTPDTSPNHLDAAVHGAILVSSTAPISTDSGGTLQIDPDGLSIYAGVLDFVHGSGSPFLLTGSDGLVHMYFAGEAAGGRDGLFSVAQYDAQSARAVFEDAWTATVPDGPAQTGALQFVAARSGSFMNVAQVAIDPSSAADLCEVSLDDGHGRKETWRGVPRELNRLVSVLNGTSTDDLADPSFRAGATTFYDNSGSYAMSRVPVQSLAPDVNLVFLARYPDVVQLVSAEIGDVTTATCRATFTFNVAKWIGGAAITQSWPNLPIYSGTALQVLAGVSNTYPYGATDSANIAVYQMAALGGANPISSILVPARADVTELAIAVADGSLPDRCNVTITLEAGGPQRVDLADVPRDQNGFAAAIDASAIAAFIVVVVDGLTAIVPNRPAGPLPKADMRAWTTLLMAFPDQPLASDAKLLAAGPIAAAVLQQSTVTVDGVARPLAGASTLFRCVPVTEPSNGGAAFVQDTTGLTGGTANLTTAAVNGGWVRVSPHMALAFAGSNAVLWDQAGPAADILALAGDVTVEAWCQPRVLASDAARPRIATYHRLGSLDFPDERISWLLGLAPAPSVNFAANTAVNGSYNLEDPNATMAVWVNPQASGGGQILRLATIGIVKSYLVISAAGDGKPVVTYADVSVSATGRAALRQGTWTQLAATIELLDANTVRVRLYVNGALDAEATGARVAFAQTIGTFSLGSTGTGYAMRANGALLWRVALDADAMALASVQTTAPNDANLVVAWYFTDGAGNTATNVALEGYPFVSPIINLPATPWIQNGVYAQPFAANRDYGLVSRGTPLLGGWAHVASAYRTAFALRLPGDQYGDCGNDASLDFDTAFSIEAWCTPARINVVQTLVSKNGNYELAINWNNTALLTVWTTIGIVRLASSVKLEAGKPYYIAATVASGSTKPGPASDKPVPQKYFLNIYLYVNGQAVASQTKDDYTDPVSISTSSVPLNLGRNSGAAAYLTGALSTVRLWNKALSADVIAAVNRTHRSPPTDGLISAWRFAESRGKLAYDDNNLNNCRLSSNTLWSLYPPGSILTLSVNGAETPVAVFDPATVGGYGDEQFTVAANRVAGALANPYGGEASEIRIWNEERTPEQIREDMYRELTGAERGLVGYWPFDAGSGRIAVDATGHGNDGALAPAAGPPAWVTSRAPISDEAKEVYNVLGGLITPYVRRIHGTPTVVEYPDTRRDAYGLLYSVMKRCYAGDQTATVGLYPGFTVGDLDTTYAGQVQTAPSVIGFIEGAPPLPSENQTNPWWTEVNYLNTYADTATVRLTQAATTTRAFSGSENDGDATSIAGKVGIYVSSAAGMSVGIGEEYDWQIFNIEGHLGYQGESNSQSNAEQELGFSIGKTTTAIDELSAGGEWEPKEHILNPTVGRRYVPDNIGYAVVKSLTADLYLVTLRGSNAVVKMQLVPNLDIPEDVNVINFPIDPHYVKNGTLDGMVGFVPDPAFPYANVAPSSYFRPLEAYALKRAIERQDKQLEAYYQQFDTANLSRAASLQISNGTISITNGFRKFRDEVLPAEPSYDWKLGLAKRSIVNTYVWTAAGGLHSEQTELVDSYSESFSNISASDSSDGLSFDLSAAFIVGLYGEFDALFSTSLEVMSLKSKESEAGFGLECEFEPDRYLKRPVLDADGTPVGYTEDDAPGKVAGYRFMSFFLPPAEANFTTFMTRVIDANWLNNSESADAAALRDATAATNGAWRVLHRVTYVNRVPPPLQPSATDTAAPPVVPPANLPANTVITRLIESQITVLVPTPAQIGAAVTAVLGTGPEAPGLLAAVLPWWTAFLTDAQDKRSTAHRELAELRPDLLDYMVQNYASAAVAAGGQLVAQLRARP
jgi:hypothetical protein